MEKINEGGLLELFRGDYIVAPKQNVHQSTSSEGASSFLVVVTDVVPSEADMNLLSNILKAVNIEISNVSIVQSKGFDEIVKELGPQYLISFGKSGFDLGIQSVQIDLYSPNEYQGIPILVIDSISKISVSQDKKKALWLNLKRVFNV